MLRQVERDARIAPATERDLAPLTAAPPQVIIDPRWRILFAFAPTIPVFASDSRFGQAALGCGRELPAGTDPARFAATNSPWAAFDSATAGRALVVVSIAPNGGRGAACGDTVVETSVAVARGLEFIAPIYVRDNNPASAGIRVGNTRMKPAFYGQTRVLRVRGGVIGRDSTQQLRLYIPLDDFRPDVNGRFPEVELTVGSSGFRADTFAIPERVLRQVWAQSLPWRIDRVDPAIHERENARVAIAGMASRDPEARRASRVLVGTTLWRGGDTLASAVVFGQVLEADPCLAISPQADPTIRDAVSRLRTDASCVPRSSSGVLARGLIFPGFGQTSSGRRGRTVGIATIALFGLSTAAALKSRQAYSDYQSATTPGAAGDFYDSASNFRGVATSLALTGIVLWGGSALEAAWKQARNNKNLREVSTYGGSR
jgi:hypothetical protein